MCKPQTKYIKTARYMEQALVALLGVKDINHISIKELCEKAGVNRSTFYNHYRTLSDLLDETISHLNDRFVSYFPSGEEAFIETVCSVKTEGEAGLDKIISGYLIPCLTFVRDNRDVYRAAFRNSATLKVFSERNKLTSHILEPIVKRLGIPEERKRYYITYYLSGLVAIVEEWMNGGCREDVETIAAVMKECIVAKLV